MTCPSGPRLMVHLLDRPEARGPENVSKSNYSSLINVPSGAHNRGYLLPSSSDTPTSTLSRRVDLGSFHYLVGVHDTRSFTIFQVSGSHSFQESRSLAAVAIGDALSRLCPQDHVAFKFAPEPMQLS